MKPRGTEAWAEPCAASERAPLCGAQASCADAAAGRQLPCETLPCEIVQRESRPWAAGARGSISLHICISDGGAGEIEVEISALGLQLAPGVLRLSLSEGFTFFSENPHVTRVLETKKWTQVLTQSRSTS